MRDGGRGADHLCSEFIGRESLCFALPAPGEVLHNGHEAFTHELSKLYRLAENNAAERLVELKGDLRKADTETFWELLTEGLAKITGAQYAFVSKRILVDDENIAVEMPPIGEPGSCLMGAAFYIGDGKEIELRPRNFKYHAYSCPCAYMRHDKVFIIPERLDEFIVNNPNQLAIPGEAYIGVPLFAEGKCVGHFGVMWSPEGAANRSLGWGYIEMLCHALEDIILERLLEGRDFAKPAPPPSKPVRVVPHDAITVAQSLKPYARSLSHELRTPMQGVVGMLDVMLATVQEAAEEQHDYRVRQVFETLKENIETVQDSSRRAVEAADNVVHAYDMNMGVPEKSHSSCDDEDGLPDTEPDKQPDIVVSGNNITFNQLRGSKRKRKDTHCNGGNVAKIPATESIRTLRNQPSTDSEYAPSEASEFNPFIPAPFDSQSTIYAASIDQFRASTPDSPSLHSLHNVVPGLRHTNLQDVLHYVINDSLKVGGRPQSAIAREINGGEVIEVRTQSPSGIEKVKIIKWSVGAGVPETVLIDEKDFAKMISCVFLNAIKFTEEGSIRLTARLSPKSRYVVINVRDTGCGIPDAFLPNLFKAFSREDDSLTRQSEGLGLGLLVAKGLARKLGGDLFCTRSETSGPNRGTDFEIRVPVTPADVCSRPGSPFNSPAPSRISRRSADGDLPPSVPVLAALESPQTPPPGSRALREDLADRRRMQSIHSPAPATRLTAPSLVRPGPSDRRPSILDARRTSAKKVEFDRQLAKKHPLTFLVAEDNKINRKLLVSMLRKLGYTAVHEAYDGADAVRQMTMDRVDGKHIDVVLMDLWMPYMDGYEAAERILSMDKFINGNKFKKPTILAVTADVTNGALDRAAKAGMKGFMTKPYKLLDLERLIVEYCAHQDAEAVSPPST
ncbi:hypothetical protein W97_08544 [Coniosporium apollinis CBS 100218]|uniref:histidine kinase n=1 Tax=Coniosporium apollinis (strain CBS 100218) TaxID=1168221 RepID=R7Z5K1_CONA1|nr:uncharacterized protein W97_08544 [Coniosporium apollinis CBS 100218]EON69186.1 hypothetical protein W97_08544 [Coniosporium apollinis CBS 100218]